MEDGELIWALVRLDDVVEVVDAYEPWKDGPWDEVDWPEVTRALVDRLSRGGSTTPMIEMFDAELQRAWDAMGAADQAGLMSYFQEPVTVTPRQVHSGGHRLKAMRRQQLDAFVGLYHRDDFYDSITPLTVYPTATEIAHRNRS